MVDKKTFWIGVMTIVAAVLLAAHALQPGASLPAAYAAQESVDQRDWAMATAETAAGGEVLYILDKRTGQLALLGWDNQAGRPVPIDFKSLPAVFNP